MGKKDASATRLPVDQYRKQIGKQDYKKTKSVLKATRLKAEAKKNSSGFRCPSQCETVPRRKQPNYQPSPEWGPLSNTVEPGGKSYFTIFPHTPWQLQKYPLEESF
ncbi:triple QxxK/R motif-containing protein isoform X1 [Toxotes jaculatrix]|uniref:triple QxxK/R motif-containing protein isoform X1 n=1 Tax=Toxotes jaculatrix TaxID=941984 RepID=UPI001B3AE810|nr:triple QxxK/R motif-containing protein isoform X1 [Toxotes jaculatrix]